MAMSSQSLRGAVEVLAMLASSGCQVRVEGDALHVHDPNKALTDELRQAINQTSSQFRPCSCAMPCGVCCKYWIWPSRLSLSVCRKILLPPGWQQCGWSGSPGPERKTSSYRTFITRSQTSICPGWALPETVLAYACRNRNGHTGAPHRNRVKERFMKIVHIHAVYKGWPVALVVQTETGEIFGYL